MKFPDVCARIAAAGPEAARSRGLLPGACALLPEPARAGEGGGAAEALQGHRALGTEFNAVLTVNVNH